MPVALEPGVRLPIVLEIDEDKPEESRPTFYVRAMSYRESGRLLDRWDNRTKGTKNQADIEANVQALVSDLILDWENVVDKTTGKTVTFSPEVILDVLSPMEVRELVISSYYARYVKPDEKKSSG